jgi:hypothetical protein
MQKAPTCYQHTDRLLRFVLQIMPLRRDVTESFLAHEKQTVRDIEENALKSVGIATYGGGSGYTPYMISDTTGKQVECLIHPQPAALYDRAKRAVTEYTAELKEYVLLDMLVGAILADMSKRDPIYLPALKAHYQEGIGQVACADVVMNGECTHQTIGNHFRAMLTRWELTVISKVTREALPHCCDVYFSNGKSPTRTEDLQTICKKL